MKKLTSKWNDEEWRDAAECVALTITALTILYCVLWLGAIMGGRV